MGDFQRSRSKVWWSHFADADEASYLHPASSAGPDSSSIPRGSSSSPSSSHKSQDSGFSDSEHSSPASSLASNPSPDHQRLPTLQESSTPTDPSHVATAASSGDCHKSSRDEVDSLHGEARVTSNTAPASDSEDVSQSIAKQDILEGVNKASVKNRSSETHRPADGNKVQSIIKKFQDYSSKSERIFSSKSSPEESILPEGNNKCHSDKLASPSQKKRINRLSLPPLDYFNPRPPSCFDLTEPPGPPAHSSTPKASAATGVNTPTRSGTTATKHARQVNLLHSFNSTLVYYPEDQGPVEHWLEEIGLLYEPECMTTLQSKSLAVDLSRQVAKMSAETTSIVQTLQEKTRIISTEFSKLVQQLDYGVMDHVGPLVQSLIGNIVEFLYDHGNKQKTADNTELIQSCDRLRCRASETPTNKQEILSDVTALGSNFTRVVDSVLTKQIKMLVSELEEPSTEMALRSALTSLTTIGLDGAHLSSLVTHCGGVRALLAVCVESKASSVRTAALRTLATVCCVAETIRQLEQAGGIDILSEILSDDMRPESEMSEAAAVLAQITAPWVDDNHSIDGLAAHLHTLVQSLTRLVSTTRSTETLLLASAALANMTFMEPQCVWALLEHRTAGQLLGAVRGRGPAASVFLQEQAATLLANMAAVPESRPHLAEQAAVVALLCFLQIRHSPLQRAPEIAAAERVQQKSAIALSRLCSDPVVALQVVELQGVSRLVRLCKEERERNHSDGVLVACLAALRKIAANCGSKVIEDLDAMELVEPRLLDSFLIYSSRQESYV